MAINPENKLQQLTELKQSIWLDYISRDLIESGQLQQYIDKGLRGMTSNPSIFNKAITNSDQYDREIRAYALEGRSAEEIYEALALADIKQAADLLKPIYDKSNGLDGFVSLEVNPHLAHHTDKTIEEVRRLSEIVNRPNVMIKVPATSEGILAIKELIAEGYNINVTLMFSLSQYELVSNAFLEGLEERVSNGKTIDQIASVSSFFVSRIDVKIDKMLENLDTQKALALRGKIGIASAKMAYQKFLEKFNTKRWEKLAQKGAHVQKVLYGSTSTKNPDYPDTLYVDSLIGKQTINTLPPKTLKAFLDHGTVRPTLTEGVSQTQGYLDQLADLGIDLEKVTGELLDEGIQKFIKPFDQLIETITGKMVEYIVE